LPRTRLRRRLWHAVRSGDCRHRQGGPESERGRVGCRLSCGRGERGGGQCDRVGGQVGWVGEEDGGRWGEFGHEGAAGLEEAGCDGSETPAAL
ncbi:hypothetical protein LTR28_001374, partial [Elasticomyces elasticus]